MDIDDVRHELSKHVRELFTLANVLPEDSSVRQLLESVTRSIDNLADELGSHYCSDWCFHDEECAEVTVFEQVPVSDRYSDLFKQALEENHAWERDRSERQLGQPSCETHGCKGTLWYEEMGVGSYLVKCTYGCRIIYVKAWDPKEAITSANQR